MSPGNRGIVWLTNKDGLEHNSWSRLLLFHYLSNAKHLEVARTSEKPCDREELLEAIQELLENVAVP